MQDNNGAVAGAGSNDGWDDAVFVYCLSLGVQFGFQTFTSKGTAQQEWYPSTVFLASSNLTALLRDVSSRCSSAGLPCAVRELHSMIFQPYDTWLQAAELQQPATSLQPTTTDFPHQELADLALYWLVYSEAANLRHTPEMLWFIFFCAQRSWQATQVRNHIEDLQQPWLRALGHGLVLAVQTLHYKYRTAPPGGCGVNSGVGNQGHGGSGGNNAADGKQFQREATFHMRMSSRDPAVPNPNTAKAAAASNRDTYSVSAYSSSLTFPTAVPLSSAGGSSASGSPASGSSAAAGSADAAAATSTSRGSSSSKTGSVSTTNSPTVGEQMAKRAQAEPAAAGSTSVEIEMSPQRSNRRTPPSPTWDPPVADYRELLLRFCPNEAAVDAALTAGIPTGGPGGSSTGNSMRFLEGVVQPLFLFLTEQVYELGQARRQGLEAAVRIGYDDVSESMAHPRVVAAALAALPPADHINPLRDVETANGDDRVPLSLSGRPQRTGSLQHGRASKANLPADDEQWYWSRLLKLCDLQPLAESTRIPWQGDMEHYRPQLLHLLRQGATNTINTFNSTPGAEFPQPAGARMSLSRPRTLTWWGRCFGGNGVHTASDVEAPDGSAAMARSGVGSQQQSLSDKAASELGRLRRANAAADWWAQHVLRKTFAEHRSLAMPLLAFKRVFQFHLIWFYLMCVLNWSEPDNRWAWVASTVPLHWGTNCLLWSMQIVLSFKPRVKRNNVVVPSYGTKEAERLLGIEPRAPFALYSTAYHFCQVILVSITWTAFFVGVYVTYTEVPSSTTCGDRGQNCYRGIFAAYTAALFAYEILYRQSTFGGYARRQFYRVVLERVRLGTASASSSCNPLYDPATHLRTGLNYLLGNALLWTVTLGIKFIIDFYILVGPAGPHLRDIMRTDSLPSSYRVGSRRVYVDLDPLMAGAQVIVLFLLSLVSTGVSYIVATALWGAMQGVVQGIGSIRHWRHIRAGFHRIQKAMRDKLLIQMEKSVIRDWQSWDIRVVSRRSKNVFKLLGAYLGMLMRRLCGLPPARAPDDTPTTRWEARERMIAVTAPLWNAIVRSLRDRDLLSNREALALSFTPVALTPSSIRIREINIPPGGRHHGGDRHGKEQQEMKMTYLPPMAVHVGQIPQLVITGAIPSSEQLEVLQEAYLCLLHLLVAVGVVADVSEAPPAATARGLDSHSLQISTFTGISWWTWSYKRIEQRKKLLGKVVELVSVLGEAGKVFDRTQAENHLTDPSREEVINKLSKTLHSVARCMSQTRDLPVSITQAMKAVVDGQHFKDRDVVFQLKMGFSMMVDKIHTHRIINYNDFVKVSTWLLAILRSNDEGTAPSSQEAVSLLADFCSGLMNPRLPIAPRVDSMRAVSTLIPHYEEPVLYALSSCDARAVLEQAGAKNLEGKLSDDDVLFNKDGEEYKPSTLLQYLLSTFPDEFQNLLERCRTLYRLADGSLASPAYTLEDFLPSGRLYDGRAQLLLWASCRGQVLARTVDGMCMYRTALALQAVHDALQSNTAATAVAHAAGESVAEARAQPGPQAAAAGPTEGGGQRFHLSSDAEKKVLDILKENDNLSVEEVVAKLVQDAPGLGALLDRKYGLVVASQVFSKMAASKSLADRWRAHGIKLLATRYSAMKVAYLEQDGDKIKLFDAPDFQYCVAHQASVLARAVPLEHELELALKPDADEEELTSTRTQRRPSPILLPDQDAAANTDMTANDGRGEISSALSRGPAGKREVALRIWQRRFLLDKLEAVEMEVLYRLQLPVNYYDRTASGVGVILGEGKPENQNSAVPYCPGVLLQTIDMNQDNSLAQAFKLRNTTREFEPLGPGRESQQVAALGYPEWIFSYRCGLLADLAAATERTFGTQIQRVMAFPSAVRANYGHPDFWHRPFIMTRGGVSKANAVQHVSEDVFGGYNALKRGGLSKYVSYISVGKGRDMGLDSILGFEGKISKGCAEQLMSRDLRFLGSNTDFFRAMSLYLTVPGHFINTWLTVVTIQLGIWVQLLLLLGGVGKTGSRVASAIGAIQILQLGTMPLLGFLFNTWLESGLGVAVVTLARHFIGGGLLFHIVRSVTSAFHLGRAVLFGGASYVATGRGFSLKRRTFTQVYCNYGRSHLYLGADILLMVILILVVGNNGGNTMPIPAAAMWSPILVAAALLAGPFWFTPFFFKLQAVLHDTREFRAWVAGSAARGVAESWPEWNASQLSALRDDAGAQVPRYRFWSTLAIVVPRAAICSLSAITAVSSAHFDSDLPDLVWVFGGSAVAWCLLAGVSACRKAYLTSGLSMAWRWSKGLVQIAVLGLLVTLAAACLFMERRGLRFSSFLITLYANYSVASLVVTVLVVWLPRNVLARSIANALYKRTDTVLGVALAIVLLLICFIGEIGLVMVDKIQTLVQFNDRYIHSQAARSYTGADDLPFNSKLRRREARTDSESTTRLLTATGSVAADGDARGRPAFAGGAQQQQPAGPVASGSPAAECATPNFASFSGTPDWYSPRTQEAFRAKPEWVVSTAAPLSLANGVGEGATTGGAPAPRASPCAPVIPEEDQAPVVEAGADGSPPLPVSYQPPAVVEGTPMTTMQSLTRPPAAQMDPASQRVQAEAGPAPQPSAALLSP